MAVNILLVDDSDTVRAIIAKTIRLAGMPLGELYQASGGEQALSLLKENWIDLVLTDINMPGMTGVELVERMSQDDEMKTIPVVVISTEGSETRVEELLAKGVRAYVRKPFTPEKIRDVVENVLGIDHGN
ncbi:MAG: response regulator [Candidatus Hydrogenedentales bacterium]|jgi:two-component system chemotaxis response regulator CheY